MLTCSGCRVARFCRSDHQKMASKSVASGDNLLTGRHKDICGLLSEQQVSARARARARAREIERRSEDRGKRALRRSIASPFGTHALLCN